MHPYLTRLGVLPEVQAFFEDNYHTAATGDLLFDYGDAVEHYGLAFHKVPVTNQCWLAGNVSLPQVRQVMVCASAMEAISWLNKKFNWLPRPDNFLFMAVGTQVNAGHVARIRQALSNKDINFLLGSDLLAQVTALKLAAGIRRLPVAVFLLPEEKLKVVFRAQTFLFSQDKFSLNAFEKASGFRFGFPVLKPKQHSSFFDELQALFGLSKS